MWKKIKPLRIEIFIINLYIINLYNIDKKLLNVI